MQNIHGKNISDFTKKIVRIKRKYVRLHIYFSRIWEYFFSMDIFKKAHTQISFYSNLNKFYIIKKILTVYRCIQHRILWKRIIFTFGFHVVWPFPEWAALRSIEYGIDVLSDSLHIRFFFILNKRLSQS